MNKLAISAAALVAGVLVAAPSDAALQKFLMKVVNITDSPNLSPTLQMIGADDPVEPPHHVSIVDESTAGSPVLRRFIFRFHLTTTVEVPELTGPGSVIFLSTISEAGPGPLQKPATFTGTGSTADASTLSWGIVTGWTATGHTWCHSSPPVICALAGNSDETTIASTGGSSDFYDLGTWFFHGTGFTASPFVHEYFTNPGNFGNAQRWVRGFPTVDATVPALPLLGMALIGGSVLAGALTTLRRRRQRK